MQSGRKSSFGFFRNSDVYGGIYFAESVDNARRRIHAGARLFAQLQSTADTRGRLFQRMLPLGTLQYCSRVATHSQLL